MLPQKPSTLSGSGCIAIACMIPIGWVLWVYARIVLWAWFVVPFGLPPLTWSWSIGLGCVAAAFWSRYPTKTLRDKGDEAVMRIFGHAIATPLFIMLVGWLVVFFGGAP